MATAAIGGHLAVTAEGAIQTAVRVVAGQGNCVAPRIVAGMTGDDNFAIGLHGHCIGSIIVAAEVCGHLAVAVERAVEATSGIIARHGQILAVAVHGVAGGEHVVPLHRDGQDAIGVAEEFREHLAITAEPGVE